MKRRLVVVVSVFLVLLVLTVTLPVSAQHAKLDPTLASRVATALAGCRVAEPPLETRGGSLADLYRAAVRSVPVVVSSDGTGSSVLIIVNQGRKGWVITNYHVVDKPFTKEGHPTVALLFYDAALKNEMFSAQHFSDCLTSSRDGSDWCQAVRHSTRWATVVSTDPSRDLALLEVGDVPSGVSGIPPAAIQGLQPGDPVAVIGHPKGLLWSLTTGIISAVRTKLPVGSGLATVIQTQAPVNPGNSGGPLINADGKLAGVVFGSRIGQTLQVGKEDITMPAEGLNYAVGIDEVLTFSRSRLK
jgi:S1-C subfamily serine protease